MTKQENLLKKLKEHQPIVVNYGRGYFTKQDVKDYATWDCSIGKYRDTTGIWDTKLLLEIARGEVENTTLEVM